MEKEFTNEDAEKILTENNEWHDKATETLNDEKKVEELIKNVIESLDNIPIIGKYFGDIPVLCLLVNDYVSGAYRKIPFGSILTIVIALIYFVSPIDLIPDIIPGIGKLDDLLVISVAVGTVHNDIADYREWKELDDPGKTDTLLDLLRK